MPKFRKKPVAIEAIQWNGKNFKNIAKFIGNENQSKLYQFGKVIKPNKDKFELYIFTLEGKHKANPGDWIIRGVKGEYYPCKPNIFELTYEKV